MVSNVSNRVPYPLNLLLLTRPFNAINLFKIRNLARLVWINVALAPDSNAAKGTYDSLLFLNPKKRRYADRELKLVTRCQRVS